VHRCPKKLGDQAGTLPAQLPPLFQLSQLQFLVILFVDHLFLKPPASLSGDLLDHFVGLMVLDIVVVGSRQRHNPHPLHPLLPNAVEATRKILSTTSTCVAMVPLWAWKCAVGILYASNDHTGPPL